MGASGKPVDGGLDSDGRKYVIAGIPLRGPLKPVFTKGKGISRGDDEDEECSTTPTAEGARIPAVLPCPPPPRKRKPSLKCNYGGGVREFFTPPDLESVFIRRHVEKAN